jgi:hypothetical protein
MKCRGKETREKIVQIYDLKPVVHVRLLKSQQRRSCTGDMLTDSYYYFHYKRKDNENEIGSFLCGTHAAHHFLELLELEKLSLFDPSQANHADTKQYNPILHASDSRLQWNYCAKQLYNAINLLVVCWDTVPGQPLVEIREKVERFRQREPWLSQIKAVNTIISKDFRKHTLTQMLDELRKKEKIREFKFDRLNGILEAHGIESKYG